MNATSMSEQEQRQMMEKFLADVRNRVDNNMRLLTDAGNIKQLSITLQELSSLSSTMQQAGADKLDLTFDEPIRIPTDVPKPKKEKDKPMPPPDPRIEKAATMIGSRLLFAHLKEKGVLDPSISPDGLGNEGKELALPMVESVADIGKMLFESLDQLGPETMVGDHPMREIEAIDLSPIGLQAQVSRTIKDKPEGVAGYVATLPEIDQRRITNFKILASELRENQDLRPAMQDILSGVKTDEIFA